MQKTIVIVFKFINRTIIIRFLGDQYVGLGSLFSSVLSVLNLAELGIGSALVYSMYEPIANEETSKICALMNFYKRCYRIIGLIIFSIGVILFPILPRLIKGTWPNDINIYVLYGMYLAETVLSYFLFAYKNCLFDAHQRKDVASKVSIIIRSISLLAQLICLLCFKNYYLYVGISLFSTILTNIVISVIADKTFPEYRCKGRIDSRTQQSISLKIRGLLSTKIGGVIINSADNIVISSFLGLTILGWYNNYYYIMDTIIVFLNILLTSLTAGIGNKIVTDDVDSNYRTFMDLSFAYQWIVTWCSVCLLCLYQPVMNVWNEKGMFPFSIVCLIVFRFFAGRTVQMSFTYKDALGLWFEDRWRPIVASIANLIVNIILVNYIGIGGVVISTFLSTIFINTPWGNYTLFKHYFSKKRLREYYKSLLSNYCVTAFICVVTFLICAAVSEDDFNGIIIRLPICCIIPNIFMMFIYRNRTEYGFFKRLFFRR